MDSYEKELEHWEHEVMVRGQFYEECTPLEREGALELLLLAQDKVAQYKALIADDELWIDDLFVNLN